MDALRRPLSTDTVRSWGIDVGYRGESREHAVLVLDHRIFDVEFDVGDDGETIGTERVGGLKCTLTEVITVEVRPQPAGDLGDP